MTCFLILVLIFSLGALLALWSLREFALGEEEKIEFRGEVRMERPGEIVLPKKEKVISDKGGKAAKSPGAKSLS